MPFVIKAIINPKISIDFNFQLHHQLQYQENSLIFFGSFIVRDLAIYHLTQHAWSISEIAVKIGFSEPGAFIRAFKGWIGVTPGAYRENDSSS